MADPRLISFRIDPLFTCILAKRVTNLIHNGILQSLIRAMYILHQKHVLIDIVEIYNSNLARDLEMKPERAADKNCGNR